MEQHELPVVQAAPMGEHAGAAPPLPASAGPAGGGGTSHCPFVQLEVQQSAPLVQAPRAAVQSTVHVLLAGSQCFEQQSASLVQEAF
jgi:hypothetical protein